MDITYKVEFFTDWHCGSGLSAGAYVDALVVKDSDGLPYLPGKTVKGLLREAAEDIAALRSGDDDELRESRMAEIRKGFGHFDGNDDSGHGALRGTAHFTNAVIPSTERQAITAGALQPYIYRTISSTAIGDDGTAVDKSLRRMEVTAPCALEGKILNLPDGEDFREIITDAMRYIKRLGQNRNRGLGRCSFSPIQTEQ
ncbi:MAG: CRISPR-associated protein [Muribaculaceae bacterium]|nr:CRISPR-associated protein [Muribaculaceae bacterium]MDE6552782.1 CRISPR-associated protein [Muribaculaceae bacterium]